MQNEVNNFLNKLENLKEEIHNPVSDEADYNIPVSPEVLEKFPEGRAEEIHQEKIIPEIKKEDVEKNIDNSKDIDIIDLALQTINDDLVEPTTVYLPGLKEEIILTPLTSIDELTLDTNRVDLKNFIHILNGITLKHISYPDNLKGVFKSLKNFEKNILATDKNLILHSLINISFEKLTEFPMTCENCGEEFVADALVKNTSAKFELTPEELMKIDFYNLLLSQKLFNGKMEIDLGLNPEWVKIFLLEKQDDEDTKEQLKNNVFFSLFTNLIQYIKEVRIYQDATKKKLVAKFDSRTKANIEKLFKFFNKMPLKTKETLIDQVDLSGLDDYLPDFNLDIICPKCHHVHEMPYQPETEFFRKALYYST